MAAVRKSLLGLAICFGIAVPCWLLGLLFPIVGAPVFAILAGALIALVWKAPAGNEELPPRLTPAVVRSIAQPGIGFTSKKILQAAVVFLGFGLNLSTVASVGAASLPIILATITTSLVTAALLCKIFNIPGRIATLIGVGSSICGGSAIAATAPVIGAKDEEVAQSISVIFFFNVVAALIFPTLGTVLGLTNDGFGLFAGTAVNDTSSVTAAAAAWDGMHAGSNALDYATVVKLTRTLAIVPITFALALWHGRKGEGAEKFSLKRAVPLFILLFLAASLITTVACAAGAPETLFAPLKTLAKFLICMAMAAIGLNTDLVKLVRTGAKPLALGATCWVAIATVSLLAQHALGLW